MVLNEDKKVVGMYFVLGIEFVFVFFVGDCGVSYDYVFNLFCNYLC